ncbi:MAG: hypothetical protein ACFE8B_08175 [Candidatus Hermodarchaeota archaeon]
MTLSLIGIRLNEPTLMLPKGYIPSTLPEQSRVGDLIMGETS